MSDSTDTTRSDYSENDYGDEDDYYYGDDDYYYGDYDYYYYYDENALAEIYELV